tara:strand:- start:2109 stop:2408 length:300 start_codon:yes stop_codon:yes gene_type:complete
MKPTTNRRKKNYIFSAFSRPPKFPMSIVIKNHTNKDILYVTYGGGRKKGGGTWSEDLANINPRTMVMISNYFSKKVFDKFEYAIQQTNKQRKGNQNESR